MQGAGPYRLVQPAPSCTPHFCAGFLASWAVPSRCRRSATLRGGHTGLGRRTLSGPGDVASAPGPGIQDRRSQMQEQGTRLAPEHADEHLRDDAGADRRTYTLTEAAERLGISRGLAYEAANR